MNANGCFNMRYAVRKIDLENICLNFRINFAEGWNNVQRGRWVPLDLKATPLHIKTNTVQNGNEQIDIQLATKSGDDCFNKIFQSYRETYRETYITGQYDLIQANFHSNVYS